MIFVNLAVADLPKAMTFWRALGYDFNPDYTDDTAACLVLSDTAFSMLMTPAKFEEFATVPPVNPRLARECLIVVSVETRADVDRIAAAAAAHGGTLHGEAEDHGFMYCRAFIDPDGHGWQFTHFPARDA